MNTFPITEVLSVTNITATGTGPAVDTLTNPAATPAAMFFLSCTSLTGTSTPTIALDVLATVGGIDHIVGSFTDVTAAVVESITIDPCPSTVKIKYTESVGVVTDFDATVHCIRF